MQATAETQRQQQGEKEKQRCRDSKKERQEERRERGMRRKGESSNENRGHEGETDTLRASGKASWRKSPGRGGFKYMRLGRRDRQEKEQGPGGGL